MTKRPIPKNTISVHVYEDANGKRADVTIKTVGGYTINFPHYDLWGDSLDKVNDALRKIVRASHDGEGDHD